MTTQQCTKPNANPTKTQDLNKELVLLSKKLEQQNSLMELMVRQMANMTTSLDNMQHQNQKLLQVVQELVFENNRLATKNNDFCAMLVQEMGEKIAFDMNNPKYKGIVDQAVAGIHNKYSRQNFPELDKQA